MALSYMVMPVKFFTATFYVMYIWNSDIYINKYRAYFYYNH